MKDDGNIIKLESPVYVKDALEAHPNHAIFEGKAPRPLSHNSELRPGRLYFLISLSADKIDHEEGHSYSSTESRKEELDKGTTTKVRVRLSKAQLASLLSADGSNVMEDLIGPLIQQALNNKALESLDSTSRPWKPRLETIVEDLSPRIECSVH